MCFSIGDERMQQIFMVRLLCKKTEWRLLQSWSDNDVSDSEEALAEYIQLKNFMVNLN